MENNNNAPSLIKFFTNPFYQGILALYGVLLGVGLTLLSVILTIVYEINNTKYLVYIGIGLILIFMLIFFVFVIRLLTVVKEHHKSEFIELIRHSKYLLITTLVVTTLLLIGYFTRITLISVLGWNLILGYLSYFISQLISFKEVINKKVLVIVLLVFWFFIYPNSIYIFTDFIHLQEHQFYQITATTRKYYLNAQGWTVLALIALTALYSAYLGIKSLAAVLMHIKLKSLHKNLLLIGYMFVASFGIYLGRFIRLNSWDFIFIFKYLHVLFDPFTYLFIILFTALQVLLLLIIKTNPKQISL